MIELSTHIEYLLLCREEVSVPGLGTFTVREMSSRRVDDEGIFLPPYRTVSFRWDSNEAGEAFIASLSKLHGLSLHEARIMCVEYADELQQALADEGSFPIGSMGYMISEPEGSQPRFVPQQAGIASPTYYGLDALPFAKLSGNIRQGRDKEQKRRRTRVTSFHAEPEAIVIRINRRLFNYVTAVAASIVLFFTFTSPYGNPTIDGESRKADTELMLAPRVISTPKVTRSSEPKVVPEKEESSAAPESEVMSDTPAQAEAADRADVQASPATKPYVIVLASAISRKNAVSFADKLQQMGYEAMACECDGMVRVIVPGFATQEDAYAEIRRMKAADSDLSNAWPYRLKQQPKKLE